ncbi:MAG TPA: hypothetical protein VHW64_14305 [Nocardioides sp.]|jgi:hypothetical protein|uniref:hypothetical protein n=1 Tax=Nocardioides sp. TaxID=35761 RepID=UPI002E36FB7B|nr:hypothetical protein [Nocardioides sp.]HEX3931872.1 hypothetical protein [Nocardioides sp.]
MERIPRVLLTLTAVPTLIAGMLTLGLAAPALADGPGVGTPVIVSMGDSSVSGEAGRWAGNTTTLPWTQVDALGSTAYWDTPSGESLPGCHRSKSAEVHVGVDAAHDQVNSDNLACSGSMTTTYDVDGQPFKPGLDNFLDTSVHNGYSQSLLLAQYAQTHNVKEVVVRVGVNNIGFDTLVPACLKAWWTFELDVSFGLNPTKSLCSLDPDLTQRFTPAAQAELKQQIFRALQTVASDMYDVGYKQNMYSVVVETYWSPIPPGNQIRYPEDSLQRQTYGGCGVFNADADWLNNTVLPALNTALRGAAALFAAEPYYPPIHILDEQYVLNGHRLCEKTDELLEASGFARWSDPGAINVLEWVQQLKTLTSTVAPYDAKEGAHANYFGQLAERACLRMEYNNGNPIDATCYPGAFSSPPSWPQTGTSTAPGTEWKAPPITHLAGEPVMHLGPLAPQAAPE